MFKTIGKGAAKQFGAEFGRAAANKILQGANSYTIKTEVDYAGRIKPSDSQVIRMIKEIQKVKMPSQNKSIVNKLLDMTNSILPLFEFNGISTFCELEDIKYLVKVYNEKCENAELLLDENFDHQIFDRYKERSKLLAETITNFNTAVSQSLSSNYKYYLSRKKTKKGLALSGLLVVFGAHFFYTKQYGAGILYLLLSWTAIVPLIGFLFWIYYLCLSQEKFDAKFNPEYVFYKSFV